MVAAKRSYAMQLGVFMGEVPNAKKNVQNND